MKYYIKGDYYFDIDSQNQLRITGPENHLFLGITFPKNVTLEVTDYYLKGTQLVISIKTDTKELRIATPVVTDIRTLRHFTEGKNVPISFSDLVERDVEDVIPKLFTSTSLKGSSILRFVNTYSDTTLKTRKYGVKLAFNPVFSVRFGKKIIVRGDTNVEFTITTISNIKVKDSFKSAIFSSVQPDLSKLEDPFLIRIYEESGANIEFLLRSKKTSSFEYGTVFPRDWIESADLGEGDLTEDTVDYMYKQSMAYISDEGEGWHEDIVGEYRVKLKDTQNVVDRKMIDIEPHYALGLRFLSKQFLMRKTVQRKLRKVASFIVKNAKEKELITFKKQDEGDQYYMVGNWRDSSGAYPGQESPLAPYDVNCIFYPESLKLISRYSSYCGIKPKSDIDELITKWKENKPKYLQYYENDIMGYALALYGRERKPLSIPHLDESYDLFYGSPSLEEVMSFVEKLVSRKYFYTPVGPMLVSSKTKLLTTRHYHGKVIWPKQAAFAIAGLVRQYKRGKQELWALPVLKSIRKAIIKTSISCFNGWQDLGFVPELYYYDARKRKARLYTDQKKYEGQMSAIQLWSSVGARRIIRDYLWILHQ